MGQTFLVCLVVNFAPTAWGSFTIVRFFFSVNHMWRL